MKAEVFKVVKQLIAECLIIQRMKGPQGQLQIVLDISVSNQIIFQSDDEISLNIKSLNFKQQVFDFAFSLAKGSVK